MHAALLQPSQAAELTYVCTYSTTLCHPRVHFQRKCKSLHVQVYTFLQDVQAMYNPEFIIKTDDDVYIRQAVQKTTLSLSMSSSLCINPLLDAQFGHVLSVPISTNSFALPAMCIVFVFVLPGTQMQQGYWFRPPDEICCIPNAASRMLHVKHAGCLHTSCLVMLLHASHYTLNSTVTACAAPLSQHAQHPHHSVHSTPITACTAPPSQHVQHPHHIYMVPALSTADHQWHVSCSTYCTVLYGTVQYFTVQYFLA